MKSLPFYIPEAWKRYPFRAEPPRIGHYREYPPPRICIRSSYDTSASILLHLKRDNLSTRRKKLKATLMLKIIEGLSPAYLQDLFSIRSAPYSLKDSEIKLNLPKPRTNYCKRALGYSGALLWNSLPVNLIQQLSVGLPHGNLVKQCCFN